MFHIGSKGNVSVRKITFYFTPGHGIWQLCLTIRAAQLLQKVHATCLHETVRTFRNRLSVVVAGGFFFFYL